MKKAIFLDRDGVINVERGEYTFRPDDFVLEEGVKEALILLNDTGFAVIVITNQAGIARGLYRREDVEACHAKMHRELRGLIHGVFYSPYYGAGAADRGSKPGTLLFQRAMTVYHIDPGMSWMVGDRERDLVPAKILGMHTVGVGEGGQFASADYEATNLAKAVKGVILQAGAGI